MVLNTDEYLSGLPPVQQAALQQLRETIASLVPEAIETISTKVPAFRYRGKYLVSFSAAKDHLALLVMQGDAMKALSDELKTHNVGSRIVRFTPEKPLQISLVEKIVRFRQAEIDMKARR
ncbi:MAG: iron chaperone [Rhodoglobus sp.]|uniref:iron chaperone n=1 Tax=Salinibacterium sp. G-O1 TaxID=3046208 RepID=UPI0024BA8191|nr:DUF1801 domain-containing protein [Salinibacterium sp. G-O1]MDJ0336096.1 DUF1801 domain-containing protein [Salinibacterium sp. G-O1]